MVEAKRTTKKGPGEGLAKPAHLLIGGRERVPLYYARDLQDVIGMLHRFTSNDTTEAPAHH